MRLLIINGVNLNMLGIREPEIYGNESYKDLVKKIKKYAHIKKIKVSFYISNSEEKIVNKIQCAYGRFDGIIINPGAFAHYSIAILDSLKAVNIPYMEVHISDIMQRDAFRKNLITSSSAIKLIYGEGFNGYLRAIDEFIKRQK